VEFGRTGGRDNIKQLDPNSVREQCPNTENTPALHQESENLFTLILVDFSENFPPQQRVMKESKNNSNPDDQNIMRFQKKVQRSHRIL